MFSFARHREFITGDVPSSNKDGNKDGGETYESPVDENHFLNVFDSFVDKMVIHQSRETTIFNRILFFHYLSQTNVLFLKSNIPW